MITKYIHSDFPGNPKNGLVNVSDAPSLPIQVRAAKATHKTNSKPIPKPDAKWTNDECYLSFIQSDELSNTDQDTVERQLMSIGVELSTPDANTLKIGAAITGI